MEFVSFVSQQGMIEQFQGKCFKSKKYLRAYVLVYSINTEKVNKIVNYVNISEITLLQKNRRRSCDLLKIFPFGYNSKMQTPSP